MNSNGYSVGQVHPAVEKVPDGEELWRVNPQPAQRVVHRPPHQQPTIEHRDQLGIVTRIRVGYALIQSTTLGWRFPCGALPAGIRCGDRVTFDLLRDPHSALRSAVNVRRAP